MLDPAATLATFTEAGVSFWTGVPDSLLKDFCGYLTDTVVDSNHVIAANEGGAVALASGHYLATGKPAVVYLQNSGLGNTINPLVSLAANEVYGIPMVLLIGWRGEPGTKDEPQHVKQGIVTTAMLEASDIPHVVLADDQSEAALQIASTVASAVSESRPHAIVVRAGTFASYVHDGIDDGDIPVSREQAIRAIAEVISERDVLVATTGKTSRELYEYRQETGRNGGQDFLTVGGMGHASQIALGIDLAGTERTVWVLDGDGALLMHLGALPVIAQHGSGNFKHIVLNNRVHDSVGGQPTPLTRTSIPDLATAAGYRSTATAQTPTEISVKLDELIAAPGPALLEIVVRSGARSDLGRPASTPEENKRAIMTHLGVQ